MGLAKDSSILAATFDTNLVIMDAQDGSILGTCDHGFSSITNVAVSDNGSRVFFMERLNTTDFLLGVADTESMIINVF